MNADGTRQKRLTENTVRDYYPRWSPEAEQIAFVTNRDGNDEVYLMNPDGKSVKNLSNNTAKDHSLAWSPDGSKIIFVSDRQQDGVDIHVMDSDGKNAERLVTNVGIETYPDFGSSRVPGMQISSDESWGYELPIDTSDLLVNSSPHMTNVTAGELAAISAMVTNSDEKRLRVVVIMQVRDEVGITQYIDTAKGALAPKGNANFTFTWTPQVPATYELVMFVIENSEHPNLLGLKTVGKVVVREPQV
jgi:dipeptidyl aminopeptidase/acylaminoacyl peptidase